MVADRRLFSTLLVVSLLILGCGTPTPARRIDKGNVALASGNVDEAIAEFEAGLVDSPDVAGLHERLAFALLRKGKAERAEKEYRRAIELDPNHARAALGMADLYWNSGRVDEARREYRRFLDLPIGDDRLLALERTRVTTLLMVENQRERAEGLEDVLGR